MDSTQREELFKQYLSNYAETEKLSIATLKGYNSGLKRGWKQVWRNKSQITSPYEIDNELKLEQIIGNDVSADGDVRKGVQIYCAFLECMRFKSLLEWFVTQLNYNNSDDKSKQLYGRGYNGGNIREHYSAWREYKNFTLDCTLQSGYQKNQSGANYIHKSETMINIYPKFTQENMVSDLQIADNKQNVYANGINDLGLFDGSYPNLQLRRFFAEYKKTMKNENIAERNNNQSPNQSECSLNMILYGPPGTGKTYNTVIKAVEILDKTKIEGDPDKNKYAELKNRYDDYVKAGRIAFVTFHQSYGYEEFIEGIKPEIINGNVTYSVKPGIFKRFCDKARDDMNQNYVFIIDEINRGNVSKIFGELITLIETTKREGMVEQATCILPYSGEPFGVPKNVYIIGTMNTADRSLVQLDTALRRRFDFEEMMPRTDLLGDKSVGEIDVKKILETINKKICVLLDREHQIGHSYFMRLNEKSTIYDLRKIFKNNVIPLLQEYFFDNYEAIKSILGEAFVYMKDTNGRVFELKKIDGVSADDFKRIYADT